MLQGFKSPKLRSWKFWNSWILRCVAGSKYSEVSNECSNFIFKTSGDLEK